MLPVKPDKQNDKLLPACLRFPPPVKSARPSHESPQPCQQFGTSCVARPEKPGHMYNYRRGYHPDVYDISVQFSACGGRDGLSQRVECTPAIYPCYGDGHRYHHHEPHEPAQPSSRFATFRRDRCHRQRRCDAECIGGARFNERRNRKSAPGRKSIGTLEVKWLNPFSAGPP
jgi:hypothetical protein